MSLVVQKYGGTSVGSLDRIRSVAERVAATYREGHQVIVVVSAMAGQTDKLLSMGWELSNGPAEREMDVLASSGEQVSAALLAIQLNEIGVPARSMLGHQARILTDNVYRKARIRTIDGTGLRSSLETGNVLVVAGFQGTDAYGNITTLGRGGSDTSAVAIAAAVKADVCEICTDVDGVYTTDPGVCSNARKLKRISYEEMLELSSQGAKVLQIRAVELAMKHRLTLHVRSSFSKEEGTIVTDEEHLLEKVIVAGVAADKNTVKLTVRALPDHPGVVASVFEPLAEASISVDMIIQNVSKAGHTHTDLTFTVSREDADRAEEVAKELVASVNAEGVVRDDAVAKVSIVGVGMRNHAGTAARMFRLLADNSINIQAISTSEIKTSCLIGADHADRAVKVLHDGFALGEPAT
ncbi:MAG: aspartate kinase [Deltaproteobacteria bacterium]|nr:aspartate kinase [Deltaproteobacteria bacterium]